MVYSLNRLRAVPQDGHASTEEKERSERQNEKRSSQGEAGEEASLQFPTRLFRSLQSYRAQIRLTEEGLLAASSLKCEATIFKIQSTDTRTTTPLRGPRFLASLIGLISSTSFKRSLPSEVPRETINPRTNRGEVDANPSKVFLSFFPDNFN